MNNPISFFKLLKVGYCEHPECMAARGSSFKNKEFPSLVGLIKHSQHGYILYDTGYSEEFFNETKTFPEKIYALVTPIFYNKKDCLLSQLKNLKIYQEDISYIIISHFHADHVSGLTNFKKAKLVFFEQDLKNLLKKNKIAQVSNAFLKGLIPSNIWENKIAIESIMKTNVDLGDFKDAFDLFGDGSLKIINLPGHTQFQAGLFFSHQDKTYFFIADAAWSIDYLKEDKKPGFLANNFFYNKKQYYQTWNKLRLLINREITLIPSHCGKTFEMLNND